MNILAIDTSSVYLSLAVMRNGKIASRYHRKAPMSHSRLLIPAIRRILSQSRLKAGDVDCFAISAGPGSFTGLRIGVVTVKALAFSLSKRTVAVPTLDVIAENAAKFRGVVCPVLDARKGKVYSCFYKSDGRSVIKISKYMLLTSKELMEKAKVYDKILFLGDAAEQVGGGGLKGWFPKASVVAVLALGEIKKRRFIKAEDLEPLYLYSRECDITGK